MRQSNERGIAMITTLLVLMLISALLIGFTTVVMSDQRYRFIDRDRGQAFYAASGAMEKLTADLGNVFFSFLSPTNSQVTYLTAARPSITGVTFTAANAPTPLAASELSAFHCASPKSTQTVGSAGYTIMFCADASLNPTYGDVAATIKTGAFEGLMAQKTPYQLDVTAKTSTGGEVHLVRTIEAVSIPVFQFGMFSDVDLAFFAGPNFSFGGRVHTNGNLFLSQGGGATLTLSDKVTAVKEVIRQRLENNALISDNPAHDGTVNMAKAPGSYVALAANQGSLVDGLGSAQNENAWHTASLGTYNGYIRNGRTGAKALNLPLLTAGGSNPDLVRRPAVNENTTNAVLYNERLYTKASLRILLSDKNTDITGLPGIDTTKGPIQLDGDWKTTLPYATYGAPGVDATHPPIARALGPVAATTTNAATLAGDTTINVNAVPAMFQKPIASLTLKDSTGNNRYQASCTDWAATQFKSCTTTLKAGSGSPSSGWTAYVNATWAAPLSAGNMPGNPNPSVTITGVSGSTQGSKVISLSSSPTQLNTFGFAANTFFINDVGAGGTAASTQVTCAGATATSFTNCSGVPATVSGATITTGSLQSQAGGTIGGWIKIEKQDTNGAWSDVTQEILNYGIGGPNLAGSDCGDPTPNAIIRLQRLRDNSNAALTQCPMASSITGVLDTKNSYEWWPNVLFDPREALLRDTAPADLKVGLGGVMYYVAIDVNNLTKWFKGTAPLNNPGGANAKVDNTGFTVYFSDRRNNRTALDSKETGEFGFEDFVNSTAAGGAPNGTLDQGEDVNANNQLDTYGDVPSYLGVSGNVPGGAVAPLNGAARAFTTRLLAGEAQVNRAIVFRRALKLIKGSNIVGNSVNGLTVVSENPVYVQGDWNANAANDGFTGAHAATSVIADAVTLLSNSWNDDTSFSLPYNVSNTGRVRSAQSWYRIAIIGGKGPWFPQPANTATDFGTDGGVHNFLRYLEGGDNTTVNYTGSIATFYYNRQAVGTYKCCNTVYGAPTRAYAFDSDFLDPSKLPPNTPVFRDMNAVGFSQELRPGK
jgi:hypothetical protein